MHSNITTERTRYKAHPSWYGRQPDGSVYYYIEAAAARETGGQAE